MWIDYKTFLVLYQVYFVSIEVYLDYLSQNNFEQAVYAHTGVWIYAEYHDNNVRPKRN